MDPYISYEVTGWCSGGCGLSVFHNLKEAEEDFDLMIKWHSGDYHTVELEQRVYIPAKNYNEAKIFSDKINAKKTEWTSRVADLGHYWHDYCTEASRLLRVYKTKTKELKIMHQDDAEKIIIDY